MLVCASSLAQIQQPFSLLNLLTLMHSMSLLIAAANQSLGDCGPLPLSTCFPSLWPAVFCFLLFHPHPQVPREPIRRITESLELERTPGDHLVQSSRSKQRPIE